MTHQRSIPKSRSRASSPLSTGPAHFAGPPPSSLCARNALTGVQSTAKSDTGPHWALMARPVEVDGRTTSCKLLVVPVLSLPGAGHLLLVLLVLLQLLLRLLQRDLKSRHMHPSHVADTATSASVRHWKLAMEPKPAPTLCLPRPAGHPLGPQC